MRRALFLSFGYPEASTAQLARRPEADGRIAVRDLYAWDDIALGDYGALLIGMHADQRFLAARGGAIGAFLEAGGTVVANGHVAYPFLPGIDGFEGLDRYRTDDLRILRLADHPIWAGVAAEHLTFRRGVAGFYGRVWHRPPPGALVVNAVGAADRPLDIVYPVGRGRVLLHGGNDLWQFGGHDTTARIVPQLLQWLFADGALP